MPHVCDTIQASERRFFMINVRKILKKKKKKKKNWHIRQTFETRSTDTCYILFYTPKHARKSFPSILFLAVSVNIENREWSYVAMVLGKLPVLGRPTIWMIIRQGPIALAVGAGGGCLDNFTLLCLFCSLSPSLSGRRPDID